MKFVIPQNYNFSSKLFGFIDYPTVIFNVVWGILVFSLVNIFISSMYLKCFVIIILCFPILIFSLIGFNHENILYVLFYILKFICRQKVYLFR